MSFVRTFRIQEGSGVPDNEIMAFLRKCERELKGIIRVVSTFIPSIGSDDPRLTVIVTKLDDESVSVSVEPPKFSVR
jgi:hypothetical protein